MLWVIPVGVTAAYLGALHYTTPQRVSPDGRVYLDMAGGAKQPMPFHLRWLLPLALRDNLTAWRIAAAVSLGTTAVVISALSGDPRRAWFAAILFLGLPIVRLLVHWPVLSDAPAMACAAIAVLLAQYGYVWPAVAVAALGSACKEQAALFAALAAWNPWLLLGLVAPLLRRLSAIPGRGEKPCTEQPLRYARVRQAPRLLDGKKMLLPWGACLAVAWDPTLPVVASLAVAYGLLLTASDSVRVYQWACIPLCVHAATVVPEGWLIPVALLHVFHPWRGDP